ncbi:MAG TPA: hypothetical protein VIU11_01040 [Nakamurella sp.]
MNRRLAGALIIVLTVVGVAATSPAIGDRLAGTPIAVRFPGPPTIGECLLADDIEDARSTIRANPPVARFGPCGPTGRGEVVAVRATTPTERSARSDSPADCRGAALSYAGLQSRDDSYVAPGAPQDDSIDWTYSIAVRTHWVPQVPSLPSASTWIACVANPEGTVTGSGRLANAFDGGALPGDFGTCWQSDDVGAGMDMVNCNEPHLAELIAMGRKAGDPPMERQQILSSCTGQAGVALRRGDPTAGGTLAVAISPDRSSTNRRPLSLTCFITSADHRRIVGSVVGIGAGQVRFAS